MAKPGRIIALDVGQARIGLAVADYGADMAFGRGYIVRAGLKEDLSRLEQICIKEGASLIVVGLPLGADGKNTKQTQRVRAFARSLEREGYSIIFEDERYSSKIAEQAIIASALSKKKRREKGLIDEAAAIIILENYLANSKKDSYGKG